jgi:hypothetical protein
VDKILSIVTTFEKAYVEDIEVPYKSIITSLCKCQTAHAATAAEQILNRFETRLDSEDGTVDIANKYFHSNPPTTETYNAVISCWKNSGRNYYPRSYTPDFHHHPHPPSNLLSHMLEMYYQNKQTMSRIRPDHLSFNLAISSLFNHQRSEYTASDQYKSTIQQQCFDHLQSMLKLQKEEYANCEPDIVTFTKVLCVLAMGKSDAGRAVQLLDEMLQLSSNDSYKYDVRPRNKHFNIVLGLMADSETVNKDTLEKATAYVQLMETLVERDADDRINQDEYYSSNDFYQDDFGLHQSSKPDTVTFNTLISIADRARQPEIAEEILEDMIKRSSDGDKMVQPDIFSFNTVR